MNVDQSPTFPELPGVRKPAQMQGFLLPASWKVCPVNGKEKIFYEYDR
jgi:hypothetical protein